MPRACGSAARCCAHGPHREVQRLSAGGYGLPRRLYHRAGTVQPPEKSRRLLEQYKAKAPKSNPADSDYTEYLDIICEDEQSWDPVARH